MWPLKWRHTLRTQKCCCGINCGGICYCLINLHLGSKYFKEPFHWCATEIKIDDDVASRERDSFCQCVCLRSRHSQSEGCRPCPPYNVFTCFCLLKHFFFISAFVQQSKPIKRKHLLFMDYAQCQGNKRDREK